MMKKILIALMACAALVGCKDEGSEFVGTWKNNDKMSETITVTQAGNGYRVLANIDEDKKGYMNVEAVLVAESETMLVREQDGKRSLELKDGGKLTSYLRHGVDDSFTKVN
jgi:ABC-type glycerol-3-phosphate transport system substrate-binding protein